MMCAEPSARARVDTSGHLAHRAAAMHEQPHSLHGKVALVTGASAGIGAAVARRLAAAGAKVAMCARRLERLDQLRAKIEAATAGAEVLSLPCDLSQAQSIVPMFDAVRERFGGVDILINNAGLGRHAPLMSGATEDWKEMFDVNVLALCVCTREAVADMRKRGDSGHVVHISSMASHRVPLESGVYSATKFAVRSLTEGLRRELREAGSAIRVSAVSPGFVETEFASVYRRDDPDAAAQTYGRYPCLQPEDVAATVQFVLEAPAHVQVHDVLVRPTAQPD